MPSIDRTILYLLCVSQGHHLVKQVLLLKQNAAHLNCFFVEQNIQKTKMVQWLSFNKLDKTLSNQISKDFDPNCGLYAAELAAICHPLKTDSACAMGDYCRQSVP